MTPDILQAVVERLKGRFPDLRVELFPDNPREYRLNHPRGALLVQFTASKFGESRATDAIIQRREVALAVTTMIRSLNGEGGAVGMMDRVRGALLGFAPPDCSKLRMRSEQFVQEQDGLWQYVSLFVTETWAVETEEADEEPGAPMSGVQFEETEEA